MTLHLGYEPPEVVNGVSLRTRAGRLKQRFSLAEELKLLGATQTDVVAWRSLFIPMLSGGIITRNADPRSWTARRGLISYGNAIRHLLGNRIPWRTPKWIGARGGRISKFIAIDVDQRNDFIDFENRRREVWRAFDDLGIPESAIHEWQTPSGGVHIYVFLYRGIPTEEIRPTLARVGIVQRQSHFEIFPNRAQALRLPFGHCPGNPFAPNAWINFIKKYESGEIQKVNWNTCKRRAINCSVSVSSKMNYDRVATLPKDSSTAPSTIRGEGARHDESKHQEYSRILATTTPSKDDIDRLLRIGICLPGSRVEATKKLAFSLICCRRLDPEEAFQIIDEWVYTTGQTTSTTVAKDLSTGTTRARQQTREIVHWFYSRRNQEHRPKKSIFTHDELNWLISLLPNSLPRMRRIRAMFLLEMFRFAKRKGKKIDAGYSCCPSINGIVRTWEGCSGMRYKPLMDWAIKVGFIKLISEKKQTKNRTGKARTYLIRIPRTMSSSSGLTWEESISYVVASITHRGCTVDSTSCNNCDTYGATVSCRPEITQNVEADRVNELGTVKDQDQPSHLVDHKADRLPLIPNRVRTDRCTEICHSKELIHERSSDRRFETTETCRGDSQCSHSGGAERSLAACPYQRRQLWPFLQKLCHHATEAERVTFTYSSDHTEPNVTARWTSTRTSPPTYRPTNRCHSRSRPPPIIRDVNATENTASPTL